MDKKTDRLLKIIKRHLVGIVKAIDKYLISGVVD